MAGGGWGDLDAVFRNLKMKRAWGRLGVVLHDSDTSWFDRLTWSQAKIGGLVGLDLASGLGGSFRRREGEP